MNKEIKERVETAVSTAKHIYNNQCPIRFVSVNVNSDLKIDETYIYLLEKIEELQLKIKELQAAVNDHEESLFRIKANKKGK